MKSILNETIIDKTENQSKKKEPGWSPQNPISNDIGR